MKFKLFMIFILICTIFTGCKINTITSNATLNVDDPTFSDIYNGVDTNNENSENPSPNTENNSSDNSPDSNTNSGNGNDNNVIDGNDAMDNAGSGYETDDELPDIPGVEEVGTIAATITDDGIQFIPESIPSNTGNSNSNNDNSSPNTSTPINLTFPPEFDATENNTSNVYLYDVDGDNNPDVIMNVDNSTALIWLYDSELSKYVYNEELSNISEQDNNAEDFNYEGVWTNSDTQIEIIYTDSVYNVIVTRSLNNSYSEWLYYCQLSGTTGQLESYGDATRTDIAFDNNGAPSSVTNKYTNGSATFSIDSTGKLIWNDAIENEGANAKFDRTEF